MELNWAPQVKRSRGHRNQSTQTTFSDFIFLGLHDHLSVSVSLSFIVLFFSMSLCHAFSRCLIWFKTLYNNYTSIHPLKIKFENTKAVFPLPSRWLFLRLSLSVLFKRVCVVFLCAVPTQHHHVGSPRAPVHAVTTASSISEKLGFH